MIENDGERENEKNYKIALGNGTVVWPSPSFKLFNIIRFNRE